MNKTPYNLILKFYWEAQTIFSAHSPFVYTFMKDIMDPKRNREISYRIEAKRAEMLGSKEVMSFVEYGAGSIVGDNAAKRNVSDVAKKSLSGKWQCNVMLNLVKHFKLESIFEIGTSLGISTAYLASGNPNAKVITLEGNPSSAAMATNLFNELDLKRIDLRVGEFGKTMQAAIDEFDTIDMAFLDGNHRKQATIDYYNLLKSKASKKSIFVVDDIYWSRGMNEAWEEIKRDDQVAFSIDLFRMGIVFFDNSIMPKQHFKLIPYKLKPWSIGLFG